MAKKIVLWIAVILCMSAIFAFSAQPAEESDELSMGVTEKIIEFVERLNDIPAFSNIDSERIAHLADRANHYVRKTAHFSIFAVLGILVYNLMASYGIERRQVVFLASLVCLLYAISDEAHQLFVPGRAGRIRDVIIDFFGSFSAIGITYLIFGRHVDKSHKEV